MKIRELMSEKGQLAKVTSVAFLMDAAKLMKEADTGIIPVVDEQNPDKILGLITDRDIAVRGVAEGIDPRTAQVKDFMTPDVACVTPDTDTKEAIRLMEDKQIRRLCVLQDEKLVGVISLGDLAVKAPQEACEVLTGVSHGAKAETK